MPSTSKKQHRFMEAVAHNPAFAKKAGVPQSVGKDFSAADKGRKFQKGGATMMGKKIPGVMADMMARRRPRMGAGMAPSAPPAPMGMKKGGKVRRFQEGGFSEAQEAWLSKDGGKPDRTDPHILERMRNAVPDSAPVEDKKPTPVVPAAPAAQSVPKVEGQDTYGNDSPDGDVGGGRTTDFKAIPKAVPQADSKTAPSKPKSLASRFNQGDVRRSEPSKPTSLASKVNQGDVRRSEPKPITKSETNAGAVTGRTFRRAPMVDINSEQYEQNRDRLLEVGSAVLPIPGVGAAVVGLRGAGKLGRYGAAEMRMLEKAAEPKLLTGPANVKRLTAPPKRITKETAAERKAAAEDAVYDARRSSDMEAMHKKGGAVKKFAKGGAMKFSKDGMHKMPDGKMMKNSAMKKFNKGGLTDDNYRQTRQKEIAEKADARAANIKNKEDVVSKRAYNQAVRMYENELRLDPKDTNPAGYAMRKFEDSVGDKMRSVGKFFGSNRVTSQDDAAQMQAREDVKGYKKGGMPMKDGKPAFMMGKKKMNMSGMAKYAKGGGIESRGKTKGTIIRMAAGGSVGSASRRADGIAQRGKTRG